MRCYESLSKCIPKLTLLFIKWVGRYQYGRKPLGVMPFLASFIKGKVLDAGCGTGCHLILSVDTLGVDIDKKKLRELQERGLQVRYLDLNKFPYPLRNEEFNTIICSHVIEHLRYPLKTLKEFHRILTNRGHLLLGIPNSNCVYHDFYDLSIRPYHINRWTLEKAKNIIEKQGFSIEYIYTSPPLFSNRFWANLFNSIPKIRTIWGDFLFVCKKKQYRHVHID